MTEVGQYEYAGRSCTILLAQRYGQKMQYLVFKKTQNNDSNR